MIFVFGCVELQSLSTKYIVKLHVYEPTLLDIMNVISDETLTKMSVLSNAFNEVEAILVVHVTLIYSVAKRYITTTKKGWAEVTQVSFIVVRIKDDKVKGATHFDVLLSQYLIKKTFCQECFCPNLTFICPFLSNVFLLIDENMTATHPSFLSQKDKTVKRDLKVLRAGRAV